MTDTLFLTGCEPVTIEVERKRIRNMYLHVNPGGRVTISAPLAFSEEEIHAFLLEKADWLKDHVRRMSAVREKNEHTYETGDTLSWWGKELPLVFMPDRQKSLTIGEDRILLAMPPDTDSRARGDFVNAQLKLRLRRAIAIRLPHWENRMGLYASAFQVRDMKSRWGSCNTGTKKLTFNLGLIAYPPECLDYVLVHELAHLRHASHDASFWALVETYMPAYREIKKRLNSTDCEQELP